MPKQTKAIPLFNWKEIFTKVIYCAVAGFLAGLGVGAYIAIVGALPTATLSIVAFPICAIGGIFFGATLGLAYGIGTSLWQGMKRSLQKNTVLRAEAAEKKLPRTNSVNLQDIFRLSPNPSDKKTVTPSVEQKGLTPRRHSFSLAIESSSTLFKPEKSLQSQLVPTKRRMGLLACFG